MEKWYLRNVKGDLDRISKSLGGISKLLSKLLLNRNITSYEIMDSFIDPSLDKLHNPELMKDMDKGIEIIVDSIEKRQKY